jgi:endonuclease/exonuclease/phosphatase family metal-dependent hydrolase
MTLGVMSWNLSDFELTTDTDDHRQQAILAHIEKAAPDIFCCQKLSSQVSPRQVTDGFDRFAARLGMAGRLGAARGTRLHVATLWREPVSHSGPWIGLGDTAHRNAALTTLEVRGGLLGVGSVHLPSASVQQRLDDVDRLLAAVDHAVPTVLAGDWNSVGEDPTVDPDAGGHTFDRRVGHALSDAGLTDVARHLKAPEKPTWGYVGDWPEIRIDAFRVTKPALAAVRNYNVDDTADHLSAHRPIWLDLDPRKLTSG